MVELQVNSEAIKRANEILADMPGGFQKAMKVALKTGRDKMKTQSTPRIRQRYAASSGTVEKYQTVRTEDSESGEEALAKLIFKGGKVPLYKFDDASPSAPTVQPDKTVRVLLDNGWRTVHPGVTASGHQLISTGAKRLTDNFVAQMPNGHVGIFERENKNSTSRAIDETMGSSVPQMVGNDEVAGYLGDDGMLAFEERLDHAVLALMNGWI